MAMMMRLLDILPHTPASQVCALKRSLDPSNALSIMLNTSIYMLQ